MSWNSLALIGIWSVFFIFWFASYFIHSVSMQKRRERIWYLYAAAVAFAAVVVGQSAGSLLLTKVMVVNGLSDYMLKFFGIALSAAGLSFSVWARITLASNWSGSPAFIEGQAIIKKGPYAKVRHPIYTGVIAMLWGTFFAGQIYIFLFTALLGTLMLYLKAELEEKMLLKYIGRDYAIYSNDVPNRILPFGIPSLKSISSSKS